MSRAFRQLYNSWRITSARITTLAWPQPAAASFPVRLVEEGSSAQLDPLAERPLHGPACHLGLGRRERHPLGGLVRAELASALSRHAPDVCSADGDCPEDEDEPEQAA